MSQSFCCFRRFTFFCFTDLHFLPGSLIITRARKEAPNHIRKSQYILYTAVLHPLYVQVEVKEVRRRCGYVKKSSPSPEFRKRKLLPTDRPTDRVSTTALHDRMKNRESENGISHTRKYVPICKDPTTSFYSQPCSQCNIVDSCLLSPTARATIDG